MYFLVLNACIFAIAFFCTVSTPAFAEHSANNPLSHMGSLTLEEAQALCTNCTPKERNALLRLHNTEPALSKKGKVYSTGYGVRVHEDCLNTFGETMPKELQLALVQGVQCLGKEPTQTTQALIKEMAEVLSAQNAPAPILYCRKLPTKNMKGVASRSTHPKQTPRFSISTEMVGKYDQEIRSVLFHEFLHLGGNGHSHGTSRELATTCQYCCFSAARFSLFTQPQACTSCRSDYAPEDYNTYLDDLGSWAMKTPGMEYLYRLNLIDSVKRAGGDRDYLAKVLKQYQNHPFGFELARKVYKRYKWTTLQKRRIRAISRKRQGHISKRYVPLAQALSDALILRFEQKAGAEDTIQQLSSLLGNTTLPDAGDLRSADRAFFNKYYYEFALIRGALAAELFAYWDGAFRSSQCPVSPKAIAKLPEQERTSCQDLYTKRKQFMCQKSGLDFDFEQNSCDSI